MFVIYELSTGRLISNSSRPIENPDESIFGVKEVQSSGIWNESSLDFDPIPAKKIKTPLEFMELFTDAELAAIYDAADANSSIKVFVKKLERAQEVDLDSPTTKAGVNALELAGLISQGRAGEILNG